MFFIGIYLRENKFMSIRNKYFYYTHLNAAADINYCCVNVRTAAHFLSLPRKVTSWLWFVVIRRFRSRFSRTRGPTLKYVRHLAVWWKIFFRCKNRLEKDKLCRSCLFLCIKPYGPIRLIYLIYKVTYGYPISPLMVVYLGGCVVIDIFAS